MNGLGQTHSPIGVTLGARRPLSASTSEFGTMGNIGLTMNQTISPTLPRNIISGNLTSQVNMVDGYLQSSNFITGVSGWQIDADGNAEFNNIIARGTINASAGFFGISPNGVQVDSTGLIIKGSGFIQTALSGQRVKMSTSGIQAFDGVNATPVFELNTGNANLIVINKMDNTLTADCIRLIDFSTDNNASVTMNCGGGSATKDGLYIQKSSNTTRRYLQHLEMVNPGSGTSILTDVLRVTIATNCTTTNGIFVNHTGGTASTALLQLASSGGSTGQIFAINNSNGVSNPLCAFFTSSAAEDVLFCQTSSAGNVGLKINNSGATSTNFYKMQAFQGNTTTVRVNIWIANNVSPNGNLSDTAGSMCLSSDGNIYRCTGTNVWVAM